MGNSSAFGSVARKALVWVIIAAVAILAFKVVIAAVVGFLQILFAIALVLLVGYAVLWAVRRL
jgi:uncharacterized membrane protein